MLARLCTVVVDNVVQQVPMQTLNEHWLPLSTYGPLACCNACTIQGLCRGIVTSLHDPFHCKLQAYSDLSSSSLPCLDVEDAAYLTPSRQRHAISSYLAGGMLRPSRLHHGAC